MEAANEDHKFLRSITRETITSDLELIDSGLQLDLSPSMVKQKLCDYPRSIETASYMVASDWWDSSGNSREEKCSILFDVVRSMGKNNTADRLESMLKESKLGCGGSACAGNISDLQQSQGACNGFIQSTSPNVIENTASHTQTVPHDVFNKNGVNIIDVSGENEGSVAVEHYDSNGADVEVCSERQESIDTTDNIVNVVSTDSFKLESQNDICNSNTKGLSSCSRVESIFFDIFENDDSSSSDDVSISSNDVDLDSDGSWRKLNGSLRKTSKEKHFYYMFPKLTDSRDDLATKSERSFENSAADSDSEYDFIPGLNSLSIDQVHRPDFNDQTGAQNDQTGVVNDQTGIVNDQTGVVNDQTGIVFCQTGVVNGQPGLVNGETEVDYVQTGVEDGKKGVVNGRTGVTNGQTGLVNCQRGVLKSPTWVDTHRGIVDSHTGLVDDQKGLADGQTGKEYGKTIQRNKDHSLSLLGNI